MSEKSRTVNIAIIGAGAWGKNLVRNFHELGFLRAVCDSDEKVLKSNKIQYSDITVTNSLDDLITQSPNNPITKSINTVVIATPAETHYEMAKEALLAEKNVYVEKPLSLKIEEAVELIQLAEKKKKILMVGHILQYHPAVIRLKELIDNGDLGKIQYIYSNRLNIGKIRTEENILWSFAPHDISIILYLLNEFPLRVSSTGGNYLQKDIADVTVTTMDFPSGIKSHIFVSWLHPFKEQKLVVVGDKKMAVFDDISKEKLFLYPHKIEWKKMIPVALKAESEIVSIDPVEPLRAECLHFIDCVANNKIPKTDGEEGLRVLRVLDAAQQSLNSGQQVSLDKCETNVTDRPDVYIHQSASVHPDAKTGKGTKIWHHCQIHAGAQIGENCVIGHNCFVGSQAKLGNGVKLECNIDVWDLVTLEDYVFVGPSAVFTNDINPRAEYPKKKYPQFGKWIPTLVKEGASIGANATIVCGNTIGKHAMIGAGAVVTKDVPNYAIIAGIPAKVIGYICECGNKLTFKRNNALCPKCGKRYHKKSDKVIFIAK